MATPSDFDADVAIVGYGPVGVSAANFLGQYGVRTVVLERDQNIYPRARAVTVNDWTLRIFQSVGLDAALTADMEVSSSLSWKVYGGRTVFRLSPQGAGLGHASSMMIYQPAMESTLREGAERFAGTVAVRFGETVTGLAQDDTGVTLTVRNSGAAESTVRAQYVLACDGGSSRIRTAIGADLIGLTHEKKWIVIDAEVLRCWPGSKELIFWSDPDRPVVDIPLALGYHRWELPLRPGENESDFDSDEAIWDLLLPLGVTAENVRVRQHAFYVHHVRQAQRWRVDRVLLAGDAAHLMPPWAGQGMQSGIRDAHNLAWKLREVLAGRLDESVLDTYQPERQPQVAAVTEMSQRMGTLIAGRDPKFVFLRNTLGPLLMRLPALTRRLLPPTAPTMDQGWLTGAPGPKSAVGRMLPQPDVTTARGRFVRLDDVLGDGFAVVAHNADPRSLLSKEQLADWTALGAVFLAVRSVHHAAATETDVIDHTGALGRWLDKYGARAVAVRPDRFVAAADTHGLDTPSPVTHHTAPSHDTATPIIAG